MYFTLMGKLNARRKNLATQDEKGFTLIELLVVVIIIGILAAIAIPVYLNVQNNAKDSAVKSDLSNAKTAVVALSTGSSTALGALGDLGQADGITAAGFTQSDKLKYAITYKPAATGTGYCIAAQSVTGNFFYETDSLGVTAVTTLPTTCTTPSVALSATTK